MCTQKRGFAEAPARASLRENEKPKASAIASGNFISRAGAFSAPFFLCLSPQKKGGKILGYFRFLSAQYATMPTTAIMTTAMIMAISVVIKGASDGSGSIGPAGDGASVTPMAVSAYELQ